MVFNITKFSNELLESLDTLNQWPNKVKTMQKNWIGKSFGCEVKFPISSSKDVKEIKCFTTRPDTLFGMTFAVLSPEHQLMSDILSISSNSTEIQNYIDSAKKKSEFERMSLTKEKQELIQVYLL